MKKRLFKCISELDNPENENNQGLLSFFDIHLSEEWEIYANPFLNGDRPAVVLLNEKNGISVIEPFNSTVKDLDQLDSLSPRERKRKLKEITSAPVHLLYGVKSNIQCLYVPQFSELIDIKRSNQSLIKLFLYCPNLSQDIIKTLFENYKDIQIICGEDLNLDTIASQFPTEEKFAIPDSVKTIFDPLRNWLIPPFHSIEQGTPIRLSDRQKEHATPRQGHFRVKAVAGSGKTLVLASRAAALASKGKRVLVVTFNKTLWHYIRAQVNRMPFEFYWENIVFKHFHGFCRDEYYRIGMHWPDDSEVKLSKEEMKEIKDANPDMKETLRREFASNRKFVELIPNRLFEGLSNPKPLRSKLHFDAILIDEGQDFCWEWYDLLCQYLKETGELVLMCDKKQNIYSRDGSWTDGGMKDVKFRGPWRTLPNLSYRLNQKVVVELNRFGNQYLSLPDEEFIEPNPNLELFNNPELLYANASNVTEMQEMVLRAYDFHSQKGTVS